MTNTSALLSRLSLRGRSPWQSIKETLIYFLLDCFTLRVRMTGDGHTSLRGRSLPQAVIQAQAGRR